MYCQIVLIPLYLVVNSHVCFTRLDNYVIYSIQDSCDSTLLTTAVACIKDDDIGKRLELASAFCWPGPSEIRPDPPISIYMPIMAVSSLSRPLTCFEIFRRYAALTIDFLLYSRTVAEIVN